MNLNEGNWKLGSFSDIANVVMGQSPPGYSYNNEEKGVGLINGPTEFTNRSPVVKQWTSKPTKLCKPGDILLCVRGSSTGRMNLSNGSYCIGRGIASISAKEGKGITDFIQYLLEYKIDLLLKRTAGSTFPNLSGNEINNMEIFIPSLDEQKEISSILSTWDKAIEQKEKLIEKKKEQNKGLMQKLLKGTVRFPDYVEEWDKVRLGKLIKEINEKSTINNQYQVLSVTKNGIVSQEEHFKKQVASKNNVGYKVIKRNNLVFSSMNLWMGSLDVLTSFEAGIVSPAYKVFEFNTDKIWPDFAKFFMKSEHMIWLYNINSEQGASVVRRNLDLKGLLNTYVRIPSVSEQEKIANVLKSSEEEINLLNQELEELKQQKRGIMQLILSTKVRIGS